MEEKRYYNVVSLEIFEVESKTKIFVLQLVVQKFGGTSKEAFLENDIRQAFKTEEALLELDTKLENFVMNQIEVSNYQQLVKDKYEDLY